MEKPEAQNPQYYDARGLRSVWYCCVCKKDTNGMQTCHKCGHHKGRWKSDKHHCQDK